MWGIYGTQISSGQFDLIKPLFGLPFLIGTVVLVSIIAFLLFGKWVVDINDDGGNVFVGIGNLGRKRSFICNLESVIMLKA